MSVISPSPNFERLLKVFYRQGEPDRLPIIELFADNPIMEAIVGERIPEIQTQVGLPLEKNTLEYAYDRIIRFWYECGYDYITVPCQMVFQSNHQESPDTAEQSKGNRFWVNESTGVIQTWEDFDRFPWPKIEQIDFSALEYVHKHLPEGMKIIFLGPGGQLENMTWLMGMTNMAFALKENPELVQAVSTKVGEILTQIWTTVADMPDIGAMWLGDDMGFRTGTLISPKDLHKHVFPWQKQLVEITHAHNLPFLLHSCGNLKAIMGDLIDFVGIDAKHSFEDTILPVTQAKAIYGHRVSILGGLDIDTLTRSSEGEVRIYTRHVIETCAPGGGWALGTGNSVANYIPVRNYLAMLEEGRKFRYS